MTNSKINEEKTRKKIRYSMIKKAHKRELEKSTRLDEENKKVELLEKKIVQTVRDVYRFIWNDINRTGL